MTTPMPDVPVAQPLVYKRYTDIQFNDDLPLGALDEYYFAGLSLIGTNKYAVTMWRIPSTSIGALPAGQKVYFDTYYATGAGNDKGDVVVVYRGVSGDWKMDKLSAAGKSLAVHTVTLSGSSGINRPNVWVSMDGTEVILIDNSNVQTHRVWGFDMHGNWLWDTMPPTNEYPYTGMWLGFPRATRGLWSNETVVGWNETGSGWCTMVSSDAPNVCTHINIWNRYYAYVGPSGGTGAAHPPPPGPYDVEVMKPFYQDQLPGQEWREYGGAYNEVVPYGEPRSQASFTGAISVPNYAAGATRFAGNWDTSMTPSSVILRATFIWNAPSKWFRTSSAVVPGTAAYEAHKAANGPRCSQIVINGVDYAGQEEVLSVGRYTAPNSHEFTVNVTVDLTADPPAPGDFAFEAFIESLYPTAQQLADAGTDFTDFPGGYAGYHYNYHAGYSLADIPYFYYWETPTRSTYNLATYGNTAPRYTRDEWDFGQIWWGDCYITLDYTFDSSGLEGGQLELRDLSAPWVDPREGTTPPLSTIPMADVYPRGDGMFPVGEKFLNHRIDVQGGGFDVTPDSITYYHSLLNTAGDALVLEDEHSIDCTEAWGMPAKSYGTGFVSSWKGQVAIAPDIQDPGPTTT